MTPSNAIQSQPNQDVQNGQLNPNQAENILNGFMARFGQAQDAQGAQGAHGHHRHHHHGGGGKDSANQSSDTLQINIDVLNYSAQGDSITQNSPAQTGQQFNGEA
jgi:hypothetical protein